MPTNHSLYNPFLPEVSLRGRVVFALGGSNPLKRRSKAVKDRKAATSPAQNKPSPGRRGLFSGKVVDSSKAATFPAPDAKTKKLLALKIPDKPKKVTMGKVVAVGGFPKDKPSYVTMSDGKRIESKKGSKGKEVKYVKQYAKEYMDKKNKAITEWEEKWEPLKEQKAAAEEAEKKRRADWDAEQERIKQEEAARIKQEEEAAKQTELERQTEEMTQEAAKEAEDLTVTKEVTAPTYNDTEPTVTILPVEPETQVEPLPQVEPDPTLGTPPEEPGVTLPPEAPTERMVDAPTTSVSAGNAGMSAVPTEHTYRTRYTGTVGNVAPELLTTTPGGGGSIVGYEPVQPAFTPVFASSFTPPTQGLPASNITTETPQLPYAEVARRLYAYGGTVQGGDTQTEAQFTDTQTEGLFTIAKMNGYEGDKNSTALEAFFSSSDVLKGKARAIGVALARGGMVATNRGYAEGGAIPTTPFQEQFAAGAGNLIANTMVPVTSTVSKVQPTAADFIGSDAGQVAPIAPVQEAAKVQTTAQTQTVQGAPAAQYTAQTTDADVKKVTSATKAAQGAVSTEIDAAQGTVSQDALAEGQTMDEGRIQQVEAGTREVGADELVDPAGQQAEAVKAEIAESEGLADAIAAQGSVTADQLPQDVTIKEDAIAQAEAITAEGLTPDARVTAARLDKFTVDNETLAKAAQGEVEALDTVQGQLSELMKSFDDGKTPAWAAGAIRAANATMAARGLGSSSMAGAAIFQAAMESALPIAQQDSQTFQQMGLANLNNRQQVALANAAAQQGLQLQNLSNEQQAALQNSANEFSLQSQNLSNMQQTMLANAQIKSAMQGQNLSNLQQSNMATAARYAEAANINLNNRQQTLLQNNTNGLNIELSNLSNKQQSYITNAQLEASLQGKQLDNAQQAAIANAARFADAANVTFSADQQAQLHNSELMKTIGLSEMNNKQAAALQNAATYAAMDTANLNNRQVARVENARNFLQMDLSNLTNDQQTTIFNAQANIDAIFNDQAQENAASQFNATSQNQTDQFFSNLAQQASTFNAAQQNAMAQFNTDSVNSMRQFNASLQDQRDQFNASNGLVVAQSNANWRQSIATMNTAAQNASNMEIARTMNAMTAGNLDQYWQRERDIMSFAFTSAENAADRVSSVLLQEMDAATKIKYQDQMAKGTLVATLLEGLFKKL